MIPETAPASPRVAEELLQRCTAIVCCGPDGCKHSESCLATEFDQRDATAIIALAQQSVLREMAEWADANVRSVEGVNRPTHNGMWTAYKHAASYVRAMMVKP